jgi:mono/diheme cytochrome c family protein
MQARWVAALVVLLSPLGPAPHAEDRAAQIERRRYMVLVGHCNNCHTAGYMQAAGQVPESKWLMGNPLGWRGKIGTT